MPDLFTTTSPVDLVLLLLALVCAFALFALLGFSAADMIQERRAERMNLALNNLHRPYSPPRVPSEGRAALSARNDLHAQPYGARR